MQNARYRLFRSLPALVIGALLITGAAGTSSAASGSLFHTEELGTLGGAGSRAYAINSSGQVVGQAQTSTGSWHACRWTNGVCQDLGALPALPNADYSVALGVNYAGDAVGYSVDAFGHSQALLWNSAGMQVLTSLGGSAGASAIDWQGNVVGSSAPLFGTSRAVEWSNNAVQDLGTLNPGLPWNTWSAAHGIGDYGTVVGTTAVPGGSSHAFLTVHGVLQDLGTLGGSHSEAFGVSELIPGDLWVVGVAEVASGARHAFMWDHGSMGDLGTPPGAESIAYSCLEDWAVGQLITSTPGGPRYAAFLRPNDGPGPPLVDLNERIDPTLGWKLLEARGIGWKSGTGGLSIVGTGLHNGQTRAFRLSQVRVTSFTVSPPSIKGGKLATGRIELNLPTPFNLVFTLSSTNPAASVPATATIKSGGTFVTFPVTTLRVSTVQSGNISESLDGITNSSGFTVTP